MTGRARSLACVLWVALLGCSLALSVLAAANDTLPGDTRIAQWLQKNPLPGQDLSDAVRAMTATEVVLAVGGAVSLILWLGGYRRQAMLLAVGLVALSILQFGVKEVVDRPRPDGSIVDIRAGYSSPGFPSGHVMSGTYLYGFLIYLALTLPLGGSVSGVLGAVAAVIIALGGVVNVWLGVHWPSDVVGGCLWSALVLLPLILLDRHRARPVQIA
ncbi:MAG TPA: phosphatase PAP2 family protein [Dehalococcoidia bacterium]|nr:phosphatase PAP2 family protein [Dehalococcoidia bacterium]